MYPDMGYFMQNMQFSRVRIALDGDVSSFRAVFHRNAT